MIIDDEKLMAFADGELSSQERAEIETLLETDLHLREKVEQHRQLRSQVASAFDGALSEPVPQRLVKISAAPKNAQVVDLSARRAVKWSVREWGAIAASVAIGLIVGIGATHQPPPMLATTASGVSAEGALEHALDTQLAADQAGRVQIGITFRNDEGVVCRTFDLTDGSASGLACRSEQGWSVSLLATGAARGEVRTAGSSSEVLNAVDQMIAGDPLDAEAERATREADWR